MPELTALTWNPHIGRADELRQLLPRVLEDAGWPVVVSLQEVWDWSGKVPGYRRVWASPVAYPHHEARGVQLLVRKRGARVRSSGASQVDGGVWVHKRPHPPRTFPWAIVRHDRMLWPVVGVHRCPGGPTAARERNRRAWRDEHRLLVDWADWRPAGPLVLLGDHNNRATDSSPLSVSGLAGRIGGSLALERIDGAVVRGCAGRAETMPDFYGSDHRPVKVHLTARRL